MVKRMKISPAEVQTVWSFEVSAPENELYRFKGADIRREPGCHLRVVLLELDPSIPMVAKFQVRGKVRRKLNFF